ncbi:MAG: response regulator [Treponema sp.]|jgi:signal transduction histidine kinase/CheY-like chemotaxis protein|nr:response regulator [Treponema sp.]
MGDTLNLETLSAENDRLKKANSDLETEVRRLNRQLNSNEKVLGVIQSNFKARAGMLESATRESEKQKRFLTYFMKNSVNFVIFLDEDDKIAYCSDSLLKKTGLPNFDHVDGMYFADFCRGLGEDAFAILTEARLDQVAEKQETLTTEVSLDLDRSGDVRNYQIQVSPMFDEEGRICGKIVLWYDNTELINAKNAADNANTAKSAFLASMSHEIRTPMNAIVGMTELILRGNLGDEERGYANDIKQAGNNLISIINDILDFSKIESGKMEIIPVNYMFPSLINDTVNIIRMRLMEKPIRFYTNIEAAIPNGLTGDETRMRQIILNILSNAAKYTQRGNISMTITRAEKHDPEKVWLKIAVSDTGTGIKPEDQRKLFGNFVQVDTRKNRGIEGTGLGLAITKRLCEAMGGDIAVESEYGKGSAFTVTIPQAVHSPEPFAAIEQPEKKKVLVYERRLVYARSVCWSLENMGVPHRLVMTREEFAESLRREAWSYVFSGYGLYEKIKPIWDRGESDFPGGKKPLLALMIEWGTEAHIPGVRFVSLPAQSLSIAGVLNGKSDHGYINAQGGFSGTRFIIPGARILVTDDLATNLRVAEGLLSPYRAKVDICLSGPEAIELIKRNSACRQAYDLIFMDHMMPEMDGVEAVGIIRAVEGDYFKTVPIIALTANAVSGMREMFLAQGFSDFLAKPIDVSKLDEILARWIPRGKQQSGKKAPGKAPEFPPLNIPGVDTAKGIAMTGGTVEGYKKVLSQFYKDAQERLALLQEPPEPEALPVFVTQVHALKSASATIGAEIVSVEAARLEAAGKAGGIATIQERLPAFTEKLAVLIEGIGAALQAATSVFPETGMAQRNESELVPLLRELAEALQAKRITAIDRVLEELNQKSLDKKTREALDAVSDDVLMGEYSKALETVTGLPENIKKE